MASTQKQLIVLAIGGNSLIVDKQHQTVRDQYIAVAETCEHIVRLIKEGYRVVITHGNGPQVGFILRRSELSYPQLHMVPLDSCGADTQGAIGYQIQQAMCNCMRDWPKPVKVATVVTQMLVDADDPAFKKPSKPIGSFMDEATAEEHRQKDNWNIVQDAGRGFRRVVASPVPKEIIELDAIRELVAADFVVVAAGGGGIPVVKGPDGLLRGADAVIDKDLATSLLAGKLNADILIISTAVEKVYLNYGKPDQKAVDSMTVAEAKQYIKAGHFAAGSMLPKIKAVVEFIEAGGKMAIITDPPNLAKAVAGQTGTRIVP
ncbi:MAG TPA: carbamate kinase [Phycisphaerae bacterium]|nr:carbamate kinase [Phycisphaerae bacterium]